MNRAAMIPLALYVHMPWCVRKCPYCDFNSHQLKTAAPDRRYIDALLVDLQHELPAVQGRRIESVFFGGGTPSLFAAEEIGRFLNGLRERSDVADDVEVTLEANPGAIEHDSFAGYKDAGVNRVSLGAQSFDEAALKALGRIHAADDTLAAVQSLKAAGIDNFNLDLMYALPGQSAEQALHDVRTACDLKPAHVSYYQLTLEPGTVFHAQPPPLPDEDTAWDMQSAGQELLAARGYHQYEVSAYAQPGARCRHNLNYWLFGDYIGIGAGAHGKLSLALPGHIERSVKQKQPREYQRLVEHAASPAPLGERARVAPADLPFEFMLNALRLSDGFDATCFEARTGLSVATVLPQLEGAQERGLVEISADKWRPTALGRRFLNDLQGAFLA